MTVEHAETCRCVDCSPRAVASKPLPQWVSDAVLRITDPSSGATEEAQ